jgi:hypothetical protein
LTIAALVRTLGWPIGSRLADELRSAEPAEIGRFDSFLIGTFFSFFSLVVGVVGVDSSGAGDDRGGSGCQARTTVICYRFLLSTATRKGRASIISVIVIGSAQGSITQERNRNNDQLPDSEGANQVIYLFRVTLALRPSSKESSNYVDVSGRSLSECIQLIGDFFHAAGL